MISIVTVTQLKRKETLKLTAEYINYQSVKDKIKEWVIVEGSKEEKDAKENEVNISLIKCNIPITYVPYIENSTLGMLRNRCNENITGDYIVCMDDDDYYSPSYVEEHFNALKKTSLSGIKDTCMYDFYLGKSYRFKIKIKPNFSLNCSLGYTASYAKNNKYDNSLNNAEEDSFLKNEEMTFIDYNSMCLNSYGDNTYNKRELIFSYYQNHYRDL
jgi:glycosyltransferase involved in cell wall biosynthesis